MAGSTLRCQRTIPGFGFMSTTGDKNHIGQRRSKAIQSWDSEKYFSGFYKPTKSQDAAALQGSAAYLGVSPFALELLSPSATEAEGQSSLCSGINEEEEVGAHAQQ